MYSTLVALQRLDSSRVCYLLAKSCPYDKLVGQYQWSPVPKHRVNIRTETNKVRRERLIIGRKKIRRAYYALRHSEKAFTQRHWYWTVHPTSK
jgi:hypothetical protein